MGGPDRTTMTIGGRQGGGWGLYAVQQYGVNCLCGILQYGVKWDFVVMGLTVYVHV